MNCPACNSDRYERAYAMIEESGDTNPIGDGCPNCGYFISDEAQLKLTDAGIQTYIQNYKRRALTAGRFAF